MKSFRTTGILLVAFVLGVVSQHMSALGASTKSPVPEIVRAHSFALVDSEGNTAGVFAVRNDHAFGAQTIVLYNARGQTIWRAGNGLEPLDATQ